MNNRERWSPLLTPDEVEMRIARSPILAMLRALQAGVAITSPSFPQSFLDHSDGRIERYSRYRDPVTSEWILTRDHPDHPEYVKPIGEI